MKRRPPNPHAPPVLPDHPALPNSALRSVIDHLDEAIVVLGPQGDVQFANATAQRVYGILPEGHPLSVWSETYGIFQPDRQTPWPAADLPGALALRGQTFEGEQYICPPASTEGYWISVTARPLLDPHGRVTSALLTWHDISAEKQTAESQRRLLAIVDNTPDCVTLTDASLKTVFINRAGRDLLGLGDDDDVRSYSLFTTEFQPQQGTFDADVLPALLRGDPWIGEVRLRHARNDLIIPVDMRAFGIFGTYGQLLGIAGISRDLTVRRQAEEARQRLAAIVEFSHDAIISESLEGFVTTWNRGAQTIFGYTAEEIVGQPIVKLAWPGYEDDMRELLRRLLAEETIEHYETMRRHKDGHCVVVSLTLSPVRDSAGKLIGISKIARDITQQKEREEVSQRQAKLLDQANEPIMVRDHQDHIVYWNKGAERLYGWSAA